MDLDGDGSAGYSLAEFDTFVRHGLAVIALVGNDASWSQIAREQVEMLGDDVATVLCTRTITGSPKASAASGSSSTTRSWQVRCCSKRGRRPGGKPVLVNAILGRTDFRKGSISM